MKKSAFLGTLAVSALMAGYAAAGTLDDVKARGELICGSNTGLTGFGAPDANGNYQGFDVALCKAIAAAVLGDDNKVKYVPTMGETRFTALASGEVDVLVRNSTWTYSRDTDLKFDFVGVNYYDGQGFMVKKDLGVSSAKELNGATVCIQTGTTTELNLSDFFKSNNISYNPVTVADDRVRDQLCEMWNVPDAPLRLRLEESMQARAGRRHELVIEQLAKRQAADVQRAKEIFAAFRANLRDSLARLKAEEDEAQGQLFTDPDQMRQWRRDIDAMSRRLDELDDEEAREIAAITDRYADVKPHTTAAAVVFALTRADADGWVE